MPLRLQSDKPQGTGSLNPLDFTSFCLEPEMLDLELWDLMFSMLSFYRTWVQLFLSVLVSFPFAVILENLTKTTSGRKCLFWLTVQGYALSSRGSQGSRGLKQLGILHPPSRTKQWMLTRQAFSSTYRPGPLPREWSLSQWAGRPTSINRSLQRNLQRLYSCR